MRMVNCEPCSCLALPSQRRVNPEKKCCHAAARLRMKESSVGQAHKPPKCGTIRGMKKQANARYPLGIREEELKNKIAAD